MRRRRRREDNDECDDDDGVGAEIEGLASLRRRSFSAARLSALPRSFLV